MDTSERIDKESTLEALKIYSNVNVSSYDSAFLHAFTHMKVAACFISGIAAMGKIPSEEKKDDFYNHWKSMFSNTLGVSREISDSFQKTEDEMEAHMKEKFGDDWKEKMMKDKKE